MHSLVLSFQEPSWVKHGIGRKLLLTKGMLQTISSRFKCWTMVCCSYKCRFEICSKKLERSNIASSVKRLLSWSNRMKVYDPLIADVLWGFSTSGDHWKLVYQEKFAVHYTASTIDDVPCRLKWYSEVTCHRTIARRTWSGDGSYIFSRAIVLT